MDGRAVACPIYPWGGRTNGSGQSRLDWGNGICVYVVVCAVNDRHVID